MAEVTFRGFTPIRNDIRLTRAIFAGLGLPNELILLILDFAHYWAESITESSDHHMLVNEWSLNISGAYPYLKDYLPQPDPRHPNESIKVKEIEWMIVSHDQGWTTDGTMGTYKTSSWFEISIARHETPQSSTMFNHAAHQDLHVVSQAAYWGNGWHLVPRSSEKTESQRLFSPAMQRDDEGKYTWWLQGNEVAKGTSVFEGEMVKRYRVLWSHENGTLIGNAGAGTGEDFLNTLRNDDVIIVWARAKRTGWENHVFGVRMTIRYSI